MESIQLGQSTLQISRLGIGGCPLGGHGWGAVDREQMLAAVRDAIKAGVTFFDTADVYGKGESETILGSELAEFRQSLVLATKFGVRLSERGTFYDNSAAWVVQAIEGSLSRLRTDYIDLYQVHYWDRVTPWEVIFETLDRIRENGKIRYVGLSNVSPHDLSGIKLPPWVVSVQLQLSLVDRFLEASIQEWITQHQLAFLSWGSLGQGILTGKYRTGASFDSNDRRSRDVYANFHGEKFHAINALLSEMEGLAIQQKRSLGQIALRWILDSVPSSVVLVGVKTPAQLNENLGCLDWMLSAEQLIALDRLSAPFKLQTSHSECD